MRLVSFGFVLSLLGCNPSPSSAPAGGGAAEPTLREPAREDPAGSPVASAPRVVPALPAPAASAPAPAASAKSECVESCIARRQMQAVAPQQIEANCRAECEKK